MLRTAKCLNPMPHGDHIWDAPGGVRKCLGVEATNRPVIRTVVKHERGKVMERLPKKWCGDDHGHWEHEWVDGIYNKQCPGYDEVVSPSRPVSRTRRKRTQK